MRRELARKLIHAGLAVLFAYLIPYTGYTAGIVLLALLFGVFLLSRVTKVFSYLQAVPRTTYGELFFALGILSAILLTRSDASTFQISMILLGTADPLASLIGMRFGKHIYMVHDEKRTYEGSLACLATSFFILSIFGVPFFMALMIGGVLTVVEAFSLRGSDNLFLPVVSVVLLQLFL